MFIQAVEQRLVVCCGRSRLIQNDNINAAKQSTVVAK